ncbi:hypothetical protein Pyn_26459 [Prunus yedoensis var. nudiflora]|uniref:Uncharacterized protein n=1 Tax=Prunus yedoensis var. nudiflora TaxID=2094558 RepID=A0A314ZGC9_PRUYE|nr:hypothetical protein Pyn_26459 [Prunus yedoensis var. nudiflora]
MAESDEGKKIGMPAGSKNGILGRANIPWSFECLCWKFVPPSRAEAFSCFAYMDTSAPFHSFCFHPSAEAPVDFYANCMGFLRQQYDLSNKWAKLIKRWAILVVVMGCLLVRIF